MKKFLILFASLFLVGCQSYKELNNSAIVNALGVDMIDGKYIVSIQIINTSKNSDEQNNLKKPIVYTGTGKTLNEALSNINSKSSKVLYLGHLELVIVGETIARNGLSETTDYFIRNNDISKNFTILVANGNTPEEILNVPTPLVNFPSGNILGSVEIYSSISGVSNNIKFLKFVKDLTNPGIEPVMSSIKIIENNNNEKNLQISSLGIFKKDKLLGFLNDEDTKGYNFITDNIKNTNITLITKDKNYISIAINNSKTKIKSQIKDNIPTIIINLSSSMEVKENNGEYDINQIKILTENKIKKMITNTINKIKEEYQSDILGFGNNLYKTKNSYWNNYKNNWNNNYFLDVKTEININLNFNNNFNILNG